MPRPGLARVCLCVLSLAGSGGAASRARFGAPHLSSGRFVLLICSPCSGLGVPVLGALFAFFPVLFFVSGLLFFPAPISARAPAVSGVLCFPALGALGLGALCFPLPPPIFSLFLFVFLFFFRPVFPPLFCSAPLLSLAVPFCCFWPRVPPALVLRRLRPPPFSSPAPPRPRPPHPLCLGVLPRVDAHCCAFCCVCPWVSCRASLALSSQCGAALRCGGRCARSVLFLWSVPFLTHGALERSCVLRCVLWCSAVWCCAGLLGAWCAVLLRAVRCSPESRRVVRRRLLRTVVLCCAHAPVSCSCVVRSSAVLLRPACLRFSPLAPPPPGVRAVPCDVCCHFAVLPFRLVFCGALLPCSVLRVEVWCPALLCCGLPSAGRVVWLPWWRCVLLSGFAVCSRVLCPGLLCCAALLRPVFAVVCCVFFLRPFDAAACCVLPRALFIALESCTFRRCVLCALCCPCVAAVWWCVLLFPAVLCAVVVLGCLAVRSLCLPRTGPCCAALCWCACVVLFVGSALFLALFPGSSAVVRCCVVCCCLWCPVAQCWVWLSVIVFWWRVSVSVSLSGRVACFPCGWCGLLRCPAPLCCVLWCSAVLWCCAVVFCSVFAALFVFLFLLSLKTLLNPLKNVFPLILFLF